jgi:hypothetical protein
MDKLNTQENMVDSIKSSDKQWAKNHFRLNNVIKQVTEQAK